MKAVKVLNSALNCGIKVKEEGEEEEEECDIVLACCEIVANDVRDLFTLFHTKLLCFQMGQNGSDFSNIPTFE